MPRVRFLVLSVALLAAAGACFPSFAVKDGDNDGGPTGGGPSDGAPGASTSGSGSGGTTSSSGGSGSGGSGSGSSSGGSGSGGSGSGSGSGGSGSGSGSGGGSGGGSGSGSGSGGSGASDGGLVPAGSFTFNFGGYDPEDTPSPVTATFTHAVQWDVTEVTVSAFTSWVNAGRPTPADGTPLDPGGPYGQVIWEQAWNTNVAAEDFKPSTGTCTLANDFYSLSADIHNIPVGPTYGSTTTTLPITCVNWFQAVAYCAWVGKRLPTQAEWQYEAVARTREYTYPWGDSFGPNDCSHSIWVGDGGLSGYNGCGFPLPVGSAPSGVSLDGVQDLEGSVMEWIWDWYTLESQSAWPPDYAGPLDDAGIGLSGRHVRGGSWVSPQSSLQSILPASSDPTEVYTNLGFRCVKTAL